MQIMVIYGGKIDRDSSLASAKAVISGLNKRKYHVTPIKITSDNRWLKEFKKGIGEPKEKFNTNSYALRSKRLIPEIAVFPLLQGKYGEDGTIQGFLDTINLPYVGSEVIGAAISMDKLKMKELFKFHQLPILPFYSFPKTNWHKNKENALRFINRTFEEQYPIFVKPSNSTCSIGVSKVNKWADLQPSVELACKYGDQIIIEKGLIKLREIEVFIIGNPNLLRCLFCGEVIVEHGFQDYEIKHQNKRKLINPVKINDVIKSKIEDVAFQAFQIINCTGYARVDFFLENNNKPYINEVTANPAFNKTKKYLESADRPKLFSELLDELIQLAIAKWNNKQEFLGSYH